MEALTVDIEFIEIEFQSTGALRYEVTSLTVARVWFQLFKTGETPMTVPFFYPLREDGPKLLFPFGGSHLLL